MEEIETASSLKLWVGVGVVVIILVAAAVFFFRSSSRKAVQDQMQQSGEAIPSQVVSPTAVPSPTVVPSVTPALQQHSQSTASPVWYYYQSQSQGTQQQSVGSNSQSQTLGSMHQEQSF